MILKRPIDKGPRGPKHLDETIPNGLTAVLGLNKDPSSGLLHLADAVRQQVVVWAVKLVGAVAIDGQHAVDWDGDET